VSPPGRSLYYDHVRARAAVLLVVLTLGALAGCRSATPAGWGTTAPPAIATGVIDARGRFREILCALRSARGPMPDDRACADILVHFPDEPPGTGAPTPSEPSRSRRRVIVVSGIFGRCLSPWIALWDDARPHLDAQGYRTVLLEISGTADSGANAQRIRELVLGLPDLAPAEQVVLVGYSKGAVDALEALARFPELAARVAALVSVAAPIAGSPIADGMAPWQRAFVETLLAPFCGGGRGAVTSVTREARRAFLARVTLPSAVRYFAVVGMVEEADVSRGLLPHYRTLALADRRNDGQVLPEDALIPDSVLLGYVRADHWAIAMPFSRARGAFGWIARRLADRNAFPRELLLEAIVRAVEERLPPTDSRW
jgi:pimeloyl-ACP methyl ester carboxylesterase